MNAYIAIKCGDMAGPHQGTASATDFFSTLPSAPLTGAEKFRCIYGNNADILLH
jgi:hypothetical protein